MAELGDEFELNFDTPLFGGESRPDTTRMLKILPANTGLKVLDAGYTWVKIKTDNGHVGFLVPNAPVVPTVTAANPSVASRTPPNAALRDANSGARIGQILQGDARATLIAPHLSAMRPDCGSVCDTIGLNPVVRGTNDPRAQMAGPKNDPGKRPERDR